MKENLIHYRTCVCNINYHVVWSVKYRRKVLTKEIEDYMRQVVYETAAEKGFTVHEFVQSAVISIRQIEMGRASFALAVVTKAMLTILLALTLRLVIWIKTSLRFVKTTSTIIKSCSLS